MAVKDKPVPSSPFSPSVVAVQPTAAQQPADPTASARPPTESAGPAESSTDVPAGSSVCASSVGVSSATAAMQWTAVEEVELFKAMNGRKPIGINKHLLMACICKRMSLALGQEVLADDVWAHMQTMYNLELLDNMETVPFENVIVDYALPTDDDEFNRLKKLKMATKQRTRNGNTRASTSSNASSTSGLSSSADGSTEMAGPSKKERSETESPVMSSVSSRNATPQPLSAKGRSTVGTRASTPNQLAAESASRSSSTSSYKSASKNAHNSQSASSAAAADTPNRPMKRTRGSKSIESNSPSTTPPPTQSKRRRI